MSSLRLFLGHFHAQFCEYFTEVVSKSIDENLLGDNRHMVYSVINRHLLNPHLLVVTVFLRYLPLLAAEALQSEIKIQQLKDVMLAYELFIAHIEYVKAEAEEAWDLYG